MGGHPQEEEGHVQDIRPTAPYLRTFGNHLFQGPMKPLYDPVAFWAVD